MDEEKRKIYDQYGKEGLEEGGGGLQRLLRAARAAGELGRLLDEGGDRGVVVERRDDVAGGGTGGVRVAVRVGGVGDGGADANDSATASFDVRAQKGVSAGGAFARRMIERRL